MNRLVFLLILCFATSCNYFENKKVCPEDLLKAELKTFNWNEVDMYPSFSNCDSISEKEDRKTCFSNTLISSVDAFLEQQNIVVSKDVNDTIRLKIIIDKKGILKVESIQLKSETVAQIPGIDSLLRQSLKEIPQLFPAIKRGQNVTTAFELPVIVKID